MKSNVVLCVLNRIFLVRNEAGAYELPKEEQYYSDDLDLTFAGIQANEAPVKSLMWEAHSSGRDIDEVIYLCSNKCFEKSIPASVAQHLAAFKDFDDGSFSAEEFFIARITEFCEASGIETPAFNPLPYNPSRPADSLPSLNSYLDGQYEVCIDITGGRRDAVILQALAVQLLKMQSPSNATGSIVYASFDDKVISKQNVTFDLIELTNAIDSFARNGRADQLCSFFKSRNYISSETQMLCEKMQDFANALSLCQVVDIDAKTKAVQEAMRDVDRALSKKSQEYRIISAALDAIEDPDGWTCEMSLPEALDEIRRANIPVVVKGILPEQMKRNLERARLNRTIVRSELLLHSLIPTMQKRFIPETEDDSRLIINSIIWCVKHQMIQQALCIYREKISECLLRLGFFVPTQHFASLDTLRKMQLASEIGLKCQIGEGKFGFGRLYFLRNSNYGEDYNDYFSFDPDKFDQLHAIVAWYKYLHGTRNRIMHVDTAQEGLGYVFACNYLGKTADSALSTEELKSDIIAALSCIKTPVSLDEDKWANSYEQARERQRQQKCNTAAIYRTNGGGDADTVCSIVELQMLLLKFAGKAREVNFEEFNLWCNQIEKKQLSKKNLGLNPNIPFCRGLSEKHGDKFSFRQAGGVTYLKFS